jgi:hypothetical protein
MKHALTLCLAALALSGCAGGVEQWGHGDWLDRVSVRPEHPVAHTPEEQQVLRAEADRLKGEGEAVRQQIAAEKSRVRRFAGLQRLKEIGDELRPVESALQGGPLPARYQPEPAHGASGA